MERVKSIVTTYNLRATLKEENTPKGCTINIPLGLTDPIPEETK